MWRGQRDNYLLPTLPWIFFDTVTDLSMEGTAEDITIENLRAANLEEDDEEEKEYEDEWYQLPPLHHTSGWHRHPTDYEYLTTPAPYLPPDVGLSPCPSCPVLPCCPTWPHRRYWIRPPPPQEGFLPCPTCNTRLRCVVCPITTSTPETEIPDPVPDISCAEGAPPLFAIRSNSTRYLASFANNVIGSICQSDGDDGLRSLIPIIQGACDRRRDSSTCLTNYTYIEGLVKKIVDCVEGARASSSKVLFDMDPDVVSVVSRMTDEVYGQRDDDHRIYLLGKLKWELDREIIWERGAAIVLNTLPGLNRYKLTDMIATQSQLFFGPDVWASARAATASDRQSCFFLDEKDGWGVNGVENHLFYFREDIGVNSHHTYWHALHGYQRSHPACHVYEGGATGCHEDRRGELFYYMHRAMLARYDTERLIAGMDPLEEFRFKKNGLVDTVYAPPWRNQNSSKTVDRWQSRLHVTCLPEYILGRDKCKVEATNVATLIEQIELLEKTIADGTYIDNGELKALNIDLLGDWVEASNKHAKHPWEKKFGSIHNQGHDIISRVGNPTNVNEVNRGVMRDTITATRDPIFYRWHLMIDQLMDGHKRKLPPYKIDEGEYALGWHDFHLTGAFVLTRFPFYGEGPNRLSTFWEYPVVHLQQKGRHRTTKEGRPECSWRNQRICVKQLGHEDFQYNIAYNFTGKTNLTATFRIFLTPKYGSDGVTPLSIEEQRNYLFPVDIWNERVTPGQCVTCRESSKSIATTARRIYNKLTVTGEERATCNSAIKQQCRCGWPHNLLLPKGSESGTKFDLIVFVTDGSKYKFNFAPELDEVDGGCKLAPIMCGMPGVGTKYPDLGLPMGYPFDRFPSPEYRGWTVERFAKGIPNMWVTEITITHMDMPWFDYFEGISETDYVAGRLKAINLTNYNHSIMDSRVAAYHRLKEGGWDRRWKPNPAPISMTRDFTNTDLSKDKDVTRQPVPISSTPSTINPYT